MKTVNKATEKTKEKIIKATVALLEANGYFGTTTQAICNKAEISAGRINYHFGSKDGLIIEIAEMIPTKIKAYIKKHLTAEYRDDIFMNAFYFDAMMIKVIFSDNDYMKKYREIYSQGFICDHIADINQDAFLKYLSPNNRLSEPTTRIMAEAYAYAITSLAKPRNYETMKTDVELTIREFLKFQLMIFQPDNKTEVSLIEEILEFTTKTHFNIKGIADIEF